MSGSKSWKGLQNGTCPFIPHVVWHPREMMLSSVLLLDPRLEVGGSPFRTSVCFSPHGASLHILGQVRTEGMPRSGSKEGAGSPTFLPALKGHVLLPI